MNKTLITLASIIALTPFLASAQQLSPTIVGNTVNEPVTANLGLVVHSVQYGFDGSPDQPCQIPTFGQGNGGGGVPFSYQITLPTTTGTYDLTEEDFFDSACTIPVSTVQTFVGAVVVSNSQSFVSGGQTGGYTGAVTSSGGYGNLCMYLTMMGRACTESSQDNYNFAHDVGGFRDRFISMWFQAVFK